MSVITIEELVQEMTVCGDEQERAELWERYVKGAAGQHMADLETAAELVRVGDVEGLKAFLSRYAQPRAAALLARAKQASAARAAADDALHLAA